MEVFSIDILKKTFVKNVYLNSYQKLSKTQPRYKQMMVKKINSDRFHGLDKIKLKIVRGMCKACIED